MLDSLAQWVSQALAALHQEQEVVAELHKSVKATVQLMEADDPGLRQRLEDAHAYAVFPAIGKAGVLIGGAFGKGEVIRNDKLIGYAGLAQLTIGIQLGGDTFSEIIAFESKQALDRFKHGKTAFAANASAVLVKAGAAASARYEKGVAVFVRADGGMMLELALGGQKFFFRPAVLGRGKKAGVARRG
jgi:lipid-binding SYLF domain-containing protein